MLTAPTIAFALVPALAVTAAASPPPTLPPLNVHQRAMVAGVVDDDAPEVLLNIRKDNWGEHYLAGNEEHLELFYPPLKDLGGVYAGVGTDQAYFFIGWMKPQFAFLTDYDPWVKRLHQVYAVLFEHADNPDDFRTLWSKRRRREAMAHLRAASLPRATINMYKWGRYLVARRFIIQRKHFLRKHPNVPTFLTDQATYDYVRTMVRQGRVKPMIGNLLADRGLRSVGHFCRVMGLPLRMLYVSNAEQYWKRYPQHFRDNLLAMPVDDRSLFVRTLASQPQNGGFRYIVQPFANMQAFVRQTWVRRVNLVVPRANLRKGEFRLERLDMEPAQRRQQWLARRGKKRSKRLPAE